MLYVIEINPLNADTISGYWVVDDKAGCVLDAIYKVDVSEKMLLKILQQ